MKFTSTRNQAPSVSLSNALSAGLAPDGGLYVPATLPYWDTQLAHYASLAEVAQMLLAPFFFGDRLQTQLPSICQDAFSFSAPLRSLKTNGNFLLELFHGPTAAFKDFGARFLAECLARHTTEPQRPITILVATSGDTGAAVAAAFHQRPGFRVVILYPEGRVSPRQAHGLGCFGDNITALRVAGGFDDCQRLVKTALNDETLRSNQRLSSANSISLGRLLPQMAYYAQAALDFKNHYGQVLNFIIPTGNLGNGLACLLARSIGLPIGEIALSTNANRVLPDYFSGIEYSPQESIATLANAMDVGAPSNFERLRWLVPDEGELRNAIEVQSVGDDDIRRHIIQTYRQEGIAICPHTATGLVLLQRIRERGDEKPWAVAATAHPAKFETIIEPLIGCKVELPATLAAYLARPAQSEPLTVDYALFRKRLLALSNSNYR